MAKATTVEATQRKTAGPSQRPIWEKIRRRAENIPAEEAAKLPTDGAAEHDHYLYGSPKRNGS